MSDMMASVSKWWAELLADGTRVVWVIVQLLLIFAAAKLLARLTQRAIDKAFHNRVVSNSRANTLATLTASTVRYAIYFIAAAWVLSVLGLSASASSLLAGAGLGGLVIGLGAQDLFKDVLSGFFLIFENQFSVGETVRIGDITALVQSVSLRTTVLRSYDGVVHIIPNRNISQISNLSRDSSLAVVELRIAHGQDVEAALAALQQAGEQAVAQLQADVLEPPQAMGPMQADEWGVTLRVVCRTPPLSHYALERAMRLACLRALEQAGITLARYPDFRARRDNDG